MNLSHLPILALDPSRNMGYALWIPEVQRVFHGAWFLGDSGNHGEYYDRFLGSVEALLRQHDLEADLRLRAVIEAPAPGAERNHASLQLSEGWAAVLKLWCFRRKIAQPDVVYINSWRSYFLAGAIKPKALKGPEATRWYKEQVVLRCNALGLHPKTNDAADAIGILKYLKDTAAEPLHRRQEQKRRETANKRAQKALDFEVGA